MLRSMKELIGYDIQARDGLIGHANDFYFDDQAWATRYLVVDTGPWILGRKVLISVYELEQPNWENRQFPLDLTKEQIENSPSILNDQPVSRQYEIELHNYYGWQPYWFSPVGAPAPGVLPPAAVVPKSYQKKTKEEQQSQTGADQPADPHLRSTEEVKGYTVQARDGDAGSIYDFIVDDESWLIRYLVVDTGPWILGRQVIFAPTWVEQISFADASVAIDLSRETIENSPSYDPSQPVNRDYEQVLHDYYGRPYYWGSK